MPNDSSSGSSVDVSPVEDPSNAQGVATAESTESQSRELWRVVSVDGSTRVFQTKPTIDPSARRRLKRPMNASVLDNDVAATALFERGTSPLPSLVTEVASPTSTTSGDELSVELTSVTQAWPSLSPGIRGAVMALIRAASTARPIRPAAAPRRE
jgi:hypothetical protein